MTQKPIDPAEFVKEAYQLDNDEARVEFYRKWARDYDRQMLDGLGYVSPTRIATLLSEYVSDPEANILDAGCGTGLTSVYLADNGFTNLDGIDFSSDMINVAAERGIYRKLLVGDLNQPLQLSDSHYDAVISSGTFTHGHVGPEPLSEIFRILRPGGLLACTVHNDLWETMGFKACFETLCNDGVAQQESLYQDQYFSEGPVEGWFCIYRKCN